MLNTLLINTRQRVVWTPEQKRQLDKTAEMLHLMGTRFLLSCGNPQCPDARIVLAQDDTNPNGRVLRCGCSDRCFPPMVAH